MDAVEVPENCPVLMGVMPLRDFNHAEYLQHEVPGMSLPAMVSWSACGAARDEAAVRAWRSPAS